MKQIANIAVIAGIVCLAACGIIWIVTGEFGVTPPVLLILGAGLTAFWLTSNWTSIRGGFHARSFGYGANAIIMSVLFIAIVVVIQLISYSNNKRWDLTETGRHSFSPQTVKVLESLTSPVHVIAFYDDRHRGPMEEHLRVYDYHGGKMFSYEFMDLNKDVQRAKELKVEQANTVVVQCGDKKEHVVLPEENKLTNAIIKVTRLEDKVIYWITGHGEKNISESGIPQKAATSAKESLEKEVYVVNELSLVREAAGVPSDCTALVLAGPETDLFPNEIASIRDYLDRGGAMLAMLDPETCPSMTALLAEFGVEIGEDYIIDPSPLSQMMGGDYLMPLVTSYSQQHEITAQLSSGNYATIWPRVRSVRMKKSLPEGVSGEWIMQAGQDSWGETNIPFLKQRNVARFDQGSDIPGPVALAVAATKDVTVPDTEKDETRYVVIGDSDFIANSNMRPGGKDIFLNSIGWLAQQDDLISIRPKEKEHQILTLTRAQSRLFFLIPAVAVPSGVLLLWLGMFIQRRKYR